MNTRSTRATPGFTLIELITVMAIIAILMALLLPQLGSAAESARRTDAASVVRNVVNAANGYRQDYGKYPTVAEALDGTPASPFLSYGDTATAHCKMDNRALLDTLRSIDRGPNANFALNPKQAVYYTQKKATAPPLPRSGLLDGSEFEPSQRGMLMDPWGVQYCFLLETDSDVSLDLGSFFTDLTGPDNAVHFSAIGFSMGKNSQIGGQGYLGKLRKPSSSEPPEDIVSWQ